MKLFFNSMGGRVFLILMLGILVSALLTMTLADNERHAAVRQVRSRLAVDRVEQIVLTLEVIPESSRQDFLNVLKKTGVHVTFYAPRVQEGAHEVEFTRGLTARLGASRNVAVYRSEGAGCPPPRAGMENSIAAGQCRVVYATLKDKTPVRLDLPIISIPYEFGLPALAYGLVFFVSVAALAYIVARMSTRPLRRLAGAANELGRDIDRPPLLEEGPTEVIEAAVAFNSMQTRIKSYVQERTRMLAAIAHDLQTPLTRLRLRLEKVADEELRQKLINDLSATQNLVREGLDLARSLDAEEQGEQLYIDSMLDSICSDFADAGQNVTLRGSTGGAKVMARPSSLQRCLSNLIDNAVKYGGYAVVSAALEGSRIVIRISDGGPGIPGEMLEKVFEPFYRLEASRSRDSGGTGLGLTIARNIALKHGGSLQLRNLPGAGLEAILELEAYSGAR